MLCLRDKWLLETRTVGFHAHGRWRNWNSHATRLQLFLPQIFIVWKIANDRFSAFFTGTQPCSQNVSAWNTGNEELISSARFGDLPFRKRKWKFKVILQAISIVTGTHIWHHETRLQLNSFIFYKLFFCFLFLSFVFLFFFLFSY